MQKLFHKDRILFAVLWIGIYVVGFSSMDGLSDAIGIPRLLTLAYGIAAATVLLLFLGKNRVLSEYGFSGRISHLSSLLYFVPLIALSSVPTWTGLSCDMPLWEALLSVAIMCLVALLEELIFRGLLFRGMAKWNLKVAILISALTFGAGHAVNLLMGEPILSALLQLVYASAVGFCFTAIVYRGGNLWPCILSHAIINSLGIFAKEPTLPMQIFQAVSMTVLAMAYGLWILCRTPGNQAEQ